MNRFVLFVALVAWTGLALADEVLPPPFPTDPQSVQERTSFQTSHPWSGAGNLRADVAMVYGIDSSLPARVKTWRDRGYIIHLMTGVSWGEYQDYLYGRFDGINHEDEAQTDGNGNKVSHGGDVYYMCPGTNYGKFLCVGVQRALDAGVEAIHLEEPEFWVRSGYSEGFKREWHNYYGEDWQRPDSSVDAQWRSSKLKYFLYRRALQQVFDYVQAYNAKTGRHVRCYVATHSLLNYAQWGIVSPESSLARVNGCDGYIAQVWTGTSREPNRYRGEVKEHTFETAFLEYGVMQNLVRATGRQVWYLNDPIEDNPDHTWTDYRYNWECTLTASLLQPEVWHYEVAPWPERIFNGRYPRNAPEAQRKPIPPAYATELQVVMNALTDMHQARVEWNAGTEDVGILVSDSLMFERGHPSASDPRFGHFYGLAMPLVKHGIPVSPVQLENAVIPHCLNRYQLLILSYQGQKPLSPDVHEALAGWVKHGGALMVVDDDSDPYNKVREWWNSNSNHYATPREHLFEQLGIRDQDFTADQPLVRVKKGCVMWVRQSPVQFSQDTHGDTELIDEIKKAAAAIDLNWQETNRFILRRGPYIIAAGLEDSISTNPTVLTGRYINLFDSTLSVQTNITVTPGSRFFLLDLDQVSLHHCHVLASACKALYNESTTNNCTWTVEGVADTPAVVLFKLNQPPAKVLLDGAEVTDTHFADGLLWVKFPNEARPRELTLKY